MYKIIVLAPSAGGKSTLMRYLREHSNLYIAETDEEVMKANHGEWPSDDSKHKQLMHQTTDEIISRDNVVCLMKDTPKELLQKAKNKGFKIIVLRLTLEQLKARNSKRIEEEAYDDVSKWFKGQLDYLESLSAENLIDRYIDGNLPTAQIANEVINLALSQNK